MMDGTISKEAHLGLIEIGYLVQHVIAYKVAACSISANGRDEISIDNMVIDDRGGAIGPVFPSDHSSIRFLRALRLKHPLLARMALEASNKFTLGVRYGVYLTESKKLGGKCLTDDGTL